VAKGQKLDEQQIEVIRAYLAAGSSLAETARQMGLPKSTVATYKKRFETECQDENEQPRTQKGACARVGDARTFEELRAQNKERFIENAGEIVSMSQYLVRYNLERAIEQREKIDRAIDVLCERGQDLSVQELKGCIRVLLELKLPDIGKLSSVMGTMYDKRALARGEPTEVVEGSAVLRFEDL
jgi:transposase-like protein